MSGKVGDNLFRASGVVAEASAEFDDDQIQSNIAMLGFKVAVNGSLVRYNLVDQAIDEYMDTSGVDAATSVNDERAASGSNFYYSGSVAVTSTNYFGSGADGAVTTSGDVTHTVLSKNGSYDGDMLVKNYTDLTISVGDVMTVDQPCRGMMIFCTGDCTINGTLSMKERGALGNPASSGGSDSNTVQSAGLQLCFQTAGGSTSFTNADTNFNGCGTTVRTAIANFGNPSSNGDTTTVVRVGGAGGAGASGDEGAPGGTIANGTGGGGAGQKWAGGGGSAGSGTAGTCFSGGSAGGACQNSSGSGGIAFAGAGGAGAGAHNAFFGGGAGNPPAANGTSGGYSGGTTVSAGGLGGLLYLIVAGDLTIGGSGKITAEGGIGGATTDGTGATYGGSYTSGGGGGGGGRTIVAYGGTLANSGSITAAGGICPNVDIDTTGGPGGTGGDGVSDTLQVTVAATSYNDMTLQSTDVTANSQPSYGEFVTLIENNAGTATVNTDIKGYISRDSGTTFTQGTLVDEGGWGTNKKILAFHDLDISGQPAGTSMCYKITTHNQSVSKITRVWAASIGWR